MPRFVLFILLAAPGLILAPGCATRPEGGTYETKSSHEIEARRFVRDSRVVEKLTGPIESITLKSASQMFDEPHQAFFWIKPEEQCSFIFEVAGAEATQQILVKTRDRYEGEGIEVVSWDLVNPHARPRAPR